jgi:hypothetical protein
MILESNDDDKSTRIGRIRMGEKSFIVAEVQNYQEARFCYMKILGHLIFQVFKLSRPQKYAFGNGGLITANDSCDK